MKGVYCVNQTCKICMYIAAHKNFSVPDIEGYTPLEVGAALRDEHFGFIRDNEGENISAKNPFFCELTAYYWIWKNSDADIVGLSHYRRYFSKYRINPDPRYYLRSDEIKELMERYDVILPERFYWRKHDVKSGYYAGAGGKSRFGYDRKHHTRSLSRVQSDVSRSAHPSRSIILQHVCHEKIRF